MRPDRGRRAAQILIVDDDRACASSIVELLREAGHQARAISDPRGAVQLAESLRPDVIILDEMMPFVDGISLCIELRERVGSAILMLSAKGDAHDRTLGLRVGADDYLTKPFDAIELEARVGALIRRHRRVRRAPPRRIGSLVVDPRRIRASANGRQLDLTPTEFKLLDVLTAQPGHVFTRDELLLAAFGGRISGPTRAVDVHLGRLRRKLEGSGVRGIRMQTRRGFGYRALPVPASKATEPVERPPASIVASVA